MVRCGSCKLTFNGIEHLLAPGEAPRKRPDSKLTESASEQQTPSSLQQEAAVEDTTPLSSRQTEPQHQSSLDEHPIASDAREQSHHPEIAPDEASQDGDEHKPQITAEFIAEFGAEFEAGSDIVEADAQNDQLDAADSKNREFDFESNRQSGEEHDFVTANDEATQEQTQDTIDINASPIDTTAPALNLDSNPDSNLAPEFNSDVETKEKSNSNSDQELDEFEQLMNLGSASESVHSQQQQNLMQQFSAQLETIEPELGVSGTTEPKPESNSNDKQKPSPLTGKLEFELTSEERALVEQADLLHQLELENRIATLDEDAKEWSRHEPHLGEVLTESALTSRPPSFTSSHATTVRSSADSDAHTDTIYTEEQIESISDSQPPAEIDGDEETPKFVLQAEKKRRYGKWQTIALFFSCLVLVFAILLQGGYFFRTQIAAQWPATKPHLLRACQMIGCQIKLPAERRMLELVGSELLILNEELRINTLAFQIQNKSSTIQEWPALELTLKDRRGKTVLQKVFQASEYLNTKSDLPKGIAALSESNHKLYFELNIAKASNYQVEIFYP
ncbi:hypothetical protein GCM10011282_29910 [Undibacterium macrobrachii]|jgi:hypothetical protein|uniref:DUF3426 domain-containing protein n=2 Tax=Undibacterium macrobrachii TaxID=1119058 RepID=A0ABQ2XLD1_9BURK|nr:hypothetical protein GCM10011282_29910 [Undibacterium macrobrachii]